MSTNIHKYNADRIELASKHTVDTATKRQKLAKKVYKEVNTPQPNNGDVKKYAYKYCFSKGFEHDAYGFVVHSKYNTLISALVSGENKNKWDKLKTIAKLVDPQTSLFHTTMGYDSKTITTKSPAPSFKSHEAGTEMVELYCMSGCRDITFDNYLLSTTQIQNSINYMNYAPVLQFYSGPLNGSGLVDTSKLFRGTSAGDQIGPYISQFLWLPVPQFSTMFNMKQLYPSPMSVDFLKAFNTYLNNQNNLTPDPAGPLAFNPNRYISSGRDLANIVHYDTTLSHGINAAHILTFGLKCPLSDDNPYKTSTTQTGFVMFGIVDLCTMIAEATQQSMFAAWYVKWNNNLKLRPEEFGARLHLAKTNPSFGFLAEDTPSNLQNSTAPETFANTPYSTYLLPQAYTEGAPAHPSFTSGHATFMGAAVTILKAWFKGTTPISTLSIYDASMPTLPLQPDPSDLTSFIGYTTLPDATNMTVNSELDKLATNVAFGRNFAGIHYRSDGEQGILLGEKVAIRYLKDRKRLYPHSLGFKHFTLTKRNGKTIYI